MGEKKEREKGAQAGLNVRQSRTTKCPSIFHAVSNTVTLSEKRVERPQTPLSTYLCAHATTTASGISQTQKHLILLILITAMLCVFCVSVYVCVRVCFLF